MPDSLHSRPSGTSMVLLVTLRELGLQPAPWEERPQCAVAHISGVCCLSSPRLSLAGQVICPDAESSSIWTTAQPRCWTTWLRENILKISAINYIHISQVSGSKLWSSSSSLKSTSCDCALERPGICTIDLTLNSNFFFHYTNLIFFKGLKGSVKSRLKGIPISPSVIAVLLSPRFILYFFWCF